MIMSAGDNPDLVHLIELLHIKEKTQGQFLNIRHFSRCWLSIIQSSIEFSEVNTVEE